MVMFLDCILGVDQHNLKNRTRITVGIIQLNAFKYHFEGIRELKINYNPCAWIGCVISCNPLSAGLTSWPYQLIANIMFLQET